MIDIITVDDKDKFSKSIAGSLQKTGDFKPTAVSTFDEAETQAKQLNAGILIIGPAAPVEAAVALADKLSRSNRGISCILVAEKLSTELLQQAYRAGFRDVVTNEVDEIVSAAYRARESILPQGSSAGAAASTEPGRVITFFSTKGGVGKTVFATNTAVGLAREKNRRVVLLDLDNQFGDVGVMLGLRPERTIADMIPAIDRLDADMLTGFLTDHASGVRALLASVQREGSERISSAQVQKIFSAARLAADFIIVDTPASFGENTLTILDASDCICLVTTLDVPSVKNTHIALQTLKLLNYPEDKIKVLLNRADSKVSLLPSEVERHLKHKIAVQIPSDRAVPRSVNEGNPLTMENAPSPILNALDEIVALAAAVQLSGDQAQSAKRVTLSEL